MAIRHALDAIGDDYYARARAATAIASTDPTFAERLAEECLWDCEDDVRALGTKHSPLTSTAVARLHELADDSHEEQTVRDTAGARLRDR